MLHNKQGPLPTEIRLHTHSRTLEIHFDEGSRFTLPCEYLRVFSPSAEVRALEGRGEVVTGREEVNISRIEPVGNYAVRIIFDDGHDTGVYSWSTLYELGQDHVANWEDYLERRKAFEARQAVTSAATPGSSAVRVRVLYFERLVDRLGLQTEELEFEGGAWDVRKLLAELRSRNPGVAPSLADDVVKVTVNKQLASLETRLHNLDEIGIVPMRRVTY